MSESFKVTSDKSELNIITNLLQAYEAEYSIFTRKKPNSEGMFPIDVSLNEVSGYLIRDHKTPIGFALKGMKNDKHDIAYFYIIPTYRRTGAGMNLAKFLIEKYKGPWQARQIEGYNLGRNFALGILKKLPNIQNLTEEHIDDKIWGKISIQYFDCL